MKHCFLPAGLGVLVCGLMSPWSSVHGLSPSELAIQRAPEGVELTVTVSAGERHWIMSSREAGPEADWSPLLGLLGPLSWTESVGAADRQFYRIETTPGESPPRASDFTLLDQEGKARHLSYNRDQKAAVLIFTGAESLTGENRARLEGLKERFGSKGVLFWLVHSDGEEGREDVIARGAGLGIPLLHDRSGAVAVEYQARAQLEAVAVGVADWRIFYQGKIAGPGENGENVDYLAEALESFLEGESARLFYLREEGMELRLPEVAAADYSREIAPLLIDRCVRCHSPGNVAPFGMTDYETVRLRAPAMKQQVLTKRMPPWHADPHYGEFANDLSLSPSEELKLISWINAGAPRANGPDTLAEFFAATPPAPDYPLAWPAALGEPDLIITLPRQEVPAHGHIAYRYFSMPVDLPSGAWLRGAVILPGNLQVVHHVLVATGASYSFINSFAGYAPGSAPVVYPDNSGRRLGPTTHLSFEVHYTPTGRPESDETRLGLYFRESPPERPVHLGAALQFLFLIPPQAREFEPQRGSFTFPEAAWLLSMQPHMHMRGLRMRYTAEYPDGSGEVLLNVPNYSFDWQTTYELAEPKYMPAGTRIVVTGAFDNSALNPHNPDPNRYVHWGEQTTDEMFIGFFTYTDAD